MTEGEGSRKAITILITVLVLIAYFFVCAEPLSPELSAKPRWKTLMIPEGLGVPPASRAALPGEKPRIAFGSGKVFGYFHADGSIGFMAEASGKVAISDASYVTVPKDRSDGILKTSGNEDIANLKDVSPFFISDRLFSSKSDGTGVVSFDARGSPLWSYDFPCQISAFSASAALVVGGTIDGWIEGIDAGGKKLFSFPPGGSRLPVVLGTAVSRSGDWIAAICGIDRQRLVVLGRGGADYRVTSHRYLDSDFREPVRVMIMEDEKHVLYRRTDGIGVWSVDGKVDDVMPIKADDFDVSIDTENKIALLAARHGKEKSIIVFRTPSTVLGTIRLPDSSDYIRFIGSSVFVGGQSWIARLDFVEE
jgi:hypothetical protein